jgi:hypothetical protein
LFDARHEIVQNDIVMVGAGDDDSGKLTEHSSGPDIEEDGQ